jgi:hypothetical protein
MIDTGVEGPTKKNWGKKIEGKNSCVRAEWATLLLYIKH